MNSQIIKVAILGLVFLGLLFFLTLPTYSKVKSARTKLDQKEKELENTQNLVAVLDQLSSQFSNLVTDLEKVEVAIPQEKDLPRLLVEIPTLATQNGLIVRNINFGKQIEKGDYKAIPIILDVKGSYLNLKSFFGAVEQNLRIFDVVSFSFGGSEGGQFDFSFTIHTYTQ